MKKLALFAALSLIIVGCGEEIEAAEHHGDEAVPGQDEARTPGPQTAIFAIPDMSLSVEKELVQVVRGAAISAKSKAEEGLFVVTFNSEELTAQALLERIHSVSPSASLEKVTEAKVRAPAPAHGKAGHGDCGGCPMKNSCGM